MISEQKISVIITSYNKEKFIQNTIKSCINQNYDNYEIIVIDTGSTDKTKYLINKFDNKIIKKIFINKKYLIPSKNQIYAIKLGIKNSSGSIICLLDGDDIFQNNKLKEINYFFSLNKNLSIIQDKVKIFSPKKIIDFSLNISKINKIFLPKFYPTSSFSFRKFEFRNFLKYRREKFELLEIDLMLFLYKKFKLNNNLIINKSLTYYLFDENGISSKYKKFNYSWFKKRYQAHQFLKNLSIKKYPYKFDYFVTNIIFKFLKIFN